MFAWTEKKNLRSQVRRLSSGSKERTYANRRAIGLVPSPSEEQPRQVQDCRDLKYKQLLLSLEGKQATCCIRVMSPSNKSRAAILLFRGRVLGCLYGSKQLEHQMLGQDALEYTMQDMASPDTLLEVYLLTEEIALATASLFHSRLMPSREGEDAYDTLLRGVQGLIATRSPGCVVISNSRCQAVCMIYVCGGQIVGVYSFVAGWLTPDFESAELCLASLPDPIVSASAVTASCIEEILAVTFSLTGLSGEQSQQRSSSNYNIDFDPYESAHRIHAIKAAPQLALRSVAS